MGTPRNAALNCYRHFFQIQPQPTLSTWILTIAARTAIDAARSASRADLTDAGAEAAETTSAAPSPEATAGDRGLGRRVAAQIAELQAALTACALIKGCHCASEVRH